MKKIIAVLLILSTISVFAGEVKEVIKMPGLPNGENNLQINGVTFSDPENYCSQATGDWEIVFSLNLFSANSSPNGVCRQFGYMESVSFSIGEVDNAFGQFVTVDSNGKRTDITKQEVVNLNCPTPDPAGRTFMYKTTKTKAYTSVTCSD